MFTIMLNDGNILEAYAYRAWLPMEHIVMFDIRYVTLNNITRIEEIGNQLCW